MDVDRMIMRASMSAEQLQNEQQAMEVHPVIRTLYDHVDVSWSAIVAKMFATET